MASHVLKDAQVYFNEFNISGLLNQIGMDYTCDVQEDTALGDDTRSRISGLVNIESNYSGYFDANEDKEFFDQIGNATKGILSVAPETANEGDTAFTLQVDEANYSTFGAIGEVMPFSVQFQSAGDMVKGVIGAVGSKSADGNSAAFNLGALGANDKLVASLHVISRSGDGPTLDVTIVSDDDGTFNSASTTRITFDQVGDATGSQFKSVNGAITDTYWRVEWDVSDSTGDYEIFVVLGIFTDL